ncbi:MAG: adenylyl-sulfate reductase [Proteobacteria bacterium]|nr:MAG: adenylyl-sulfate reductase [Pseudomonadota bacterium]
MFTSNPFADLTVFLPPFAMQAFIVLMIIAVAIGTVLDMLHKSSAKFFALHVAKSNAAATRYLSGAETATLAVKTVAIEVAAAGEFCNPQRRISHLLMFYGFLFYLITTVAMIFGYPTHAMPTPVVLPVLWNIGVIMILIGGYWFFFLLRVNVVHDGQPVFRLVLADLFIVTLLGSVTFALIWEFVQTSGNLAATKITFGLYVFFTTLLFGSVRWSKFAHMFFKPVVAFQRRVDEARGVSSLPAPATRNNRS